MPVADIGINGRGHTGGLKAVPTAMVQGAEPPLGRSGGKAPPPQKLKNTLD